MAWSEDSFADRRNAVKARYGIGNGPLTAAIAAIENSRQLGVLLGKLHPPVHLTRERILLLAGLWLQAHPPRQGSGGMRVLTGKDIRKLLERGMPEQMKLDAEVAETFTFEEFADAEAIFYVGTVPLMGEEYEAKLQRTLAEHGAGATGGRRSTTSCPRPTS